MIGGSSYEMDLRRMAAMHMAPLPDMVFFEPSGVFVDWLVRLAGRREVVDCGCGTGELVRRVVEAGGKAIGLDVADREGQVVDVVPIDATAFPFTSRHVAVLARPSRGEWIREVIEKAHEAGADVVYVGLPKHHAEDVGDLEGVECVMTDAGRDGESVYLLRGGREMGKTRFVLLKWMKGFCGPGTFMGPCWFEDGVSRWVNHSGGGFEKSPDKEEIVDECHAEDIFELDWTRTTYNRPDSEIGWLAPDGRWHGCGSQDHDFVAEMILKMPTREAEKTHVRVDGPRCVEMGGPGWRFQGRRLTAEQRNWLSLRGYKVEDFD